MNPLNRQAIERLMHYYYCIQEEFNNMNSDCPVLSSSQLANHLALDDSQVRKDMAAIGVKGHRHVGFDTNEVVDKIRQSLGFTQNYPAVLLGAGRLGGALAAYEGFNKFGLDIIALFDADQRKIGLSISGHIIQPLEQLEPVIKRNQIHLGILTVPAEAAQELTDRLIKAGIQVLWNFSPARLLVSDSIFIRHEHLFVGLGQLSYYIKKINNPES